MEQMKSAPAKPPETYFMLIGSHTPPLSGQSDGRDSRGRFAQVDSRRRHHVGAFHSV